MTNKNTAYLVGGLFLVTSFFVRSDVYLICSSIFFSAYFIMSEMEDLAQKNKNKNESN
jgi:hypothetical protein